ncbi:MAG: hypothetical protein KY391_01165 [Actinobacteria bacterium]|nr:hypothetical protein [Actinomycetota bacterium]
MHRRLFAALAAASLIAVAAPVSAKAPVATLDAGDTAFFKGPVIERSSGSDCNSAECFTYRLHVTQRAYRLRIGLDKPEIGDEFVARVTDPDGTSYQVAVRPDLYSDELELEDPIVGVYEVVVRADDVTDSAFRLRAKLEARPPSVGVRRGPVLPNLQILPPHDASFLYPVTNGATAGTSVGANTFGTASCHPEEYVEDRAVRCLRFSYGVRNTGLGPMDLFTGAGNQLERELFQRILLAQGGYIQRRAGVAKYHKTHAHFHHDAAIGIQLMKVENRKTGKLSAAGSKRTKGFAHRNELLRDWERFYPTPTMSGIGLLPGWADIYEWDRPGNYIDFGLNGDGYYVVRMWADPVRGIKESNERDNRGYTYLKVTGDAVKLLEAGRGSDPWDPCKIVVGFGGHPDPEQKGRPRRCPPDTT